MRCFVNERPVEVAVGGTVRDAVRAFDADLVPGLDDGLLVTDGRGLPVAPGDAVTNGSILRVSRSARTAGHADA
jgi:hypothetical protein